MSKIKYHYNPKTFQYEPARITLKDVCWYISGLLFVGLLFFGGMITVHDALFESATERNLRYENSVLAKHKEILEANLLAVDSRLAELKEADRQLYSRLFDEPPPAPPLEGTLTKEQVLLADADGFRNLLNAVVARSHKLKQQSRQTNLVFANHISIDKSDVATLSRIPSIQPIANLELDMLVSGFGERINPFHKGKHLHSGLDFAAPRGTEVVSTAPGKVVAVNRTDLQAGYGNYIDIEHDNGFKTRYAHLEDIKIRWGQKVTKGMVIGTVGSSGGSMAPHLHYEVISDGTPVDPVLYLMEGISSNDHDRLEELSQKQNQSLD